MRISDWSSDLCSSDLIGFRQEGGGAGRGEAIFLRPQHDVDRAAAVIEAVGEFVFVALFRRSILQRQAVAGLPRAARKAAEIGTEPGGEQGGQPGQMS